MVAWIGCIVLLHAAYSSYEQHQITQITQIKRGITHDVILEVILGLFAIFYGTIRSLKNSERLSVNTAERILPREKYLAPIQLSKAMLAEKDVEISEHEWLHSRVDMMDIRKRGSLTSNGQVDHDIEWNREIHFAFGTAE